MAAKERDGERVAGLTTGGGEQSGLEKPRMARGSVRAETKVVSPVSNPKDRESEVIADVALGDAQADEFVASCCRAGPQPRHFADHPRGGRVREGVLRRGQAGRSIRSGKMDRAHRLQKTCGGRGSYPT
ncbi:MAG TPA: hypothetical protein VH092_18170 [Urbifossiella sp.]|nr:hypothetical protein [Urbifossiella sp.]